MFDLHKDLLFLDKKLTDTRLLEEVKAELGLEVFHFQNILKFLILKI